MHLRLDAIPSPAAVCIDGNVIEGVKTEFPEIPVVRSAQSAGLRVTVPEVEDSPVNEADSLGDIGKEWLSPGPIVLLLAAIGGGGQHPIVKFCDCGAHNRSISLAQ